MLIWWIVLNVRSTKYHGVSVVKCHLIFTFNFLITSVNWSPCHAIHSRNHDRKLTIIFPPTLHYVSYSWVLSLITFFRGTSRSKLEALINTCCEVMVNFRLQLQEMYCKAGRPLGRRNLKKNKEYTLNGLLLLILRIFLFLAATCIYIYIYIYADPSGRAV